ncbi:MAG: triose-phosphate isomerase [Cytophagales bacterium]|nr:triose-phosphate isomerase [Cytophagales bacterium]
MRKKIVAGNWKLNNTVADSEALASAVAELATEVEGVNIVVCPTSVNLYPVKAKLNDSVALGAQNCYDKESGAFTGEVSAKMLTSIGAEYVILGHSERREYFGESNEFLKAKTDAVLAEGLVPLFCCGETLEQRESGIHFDFVKSQLTESLFHLSAEAIQDVVIAYEPIWAIGTGVTASSDQAQEMHKELRDHLASKYGQEVADKISILYGGSCKPANAEEIFAKPDVDGGLIGGAALKAEDFIAIAKSF